MHKIKINVGAGPRWSKDGWSVLDHKIQCVNKKGGGGVIHGTAECINMDDETVDVIFTSHMFEHIPQCRLPIVIREFYRVMKPGGVLRILTPDLKKLATAYVNKDMNFWEEALSEDENVRTDLGIGGSFLNFIISPGQDTALFTRDLSNFITGLAHQACYDFEMLSIILRKAGFIKIQEVNFCESSVEDFSEPLHVDGLAPVWENMNQSFYKKHNLIHYYDEADKQYHINFTLTGFDRDPKTSLIIECLKPNVVLKQEETTKDERNYERYGNSLLGDEIFSKKLNSIKAILSAN